MSAFLRKNGGWLILAVCMVALLVLLPFIENAEVNVDLAFRIVLENRTETEVDGIRLKWTMDNQSGVLDVLNTEDLVRVPLRPGERMNIDYSLKSIDGVQFPSRFRSEFAVLDELYTKLLEVVVTGTVDFEVDKGGEYLIVLEGSHGSYKLHQEEFLSD